MLDIQSYKVNIFADGADIDAILRLASNPLIAGFTCNPTLMRKAGVADYESFARQALQSIPDKPVSFEVLSDDFQEMEAQAKTIASWGSNVFVKIPITNTKGQSSLELIKRLSPQIHLNVTAMTTVDQVKSVVPALCGGLESYVSVFAGRIADSGRDPLPVMRSCLEILALPDNQHIKLLWASPREVYNIVQAEDIGCHIITVTDDILKKIPLLGGDLLKVSLDTVKMFYNDGQTAGYDIKTIEDRAKAI
jgi:transaldolase